MSRRKRELIQAREQSKLQDQADEVCKELKPLKFLFFKGLLGKIFIVETLSAELILAW